MQHEPEYKRLPWQWSTLEERAYTESNWVISIQKVYFYFVLNILFQINQCNYSPTPLGTHHPLILSDLVPSADFRATIVVPSLDFRATLSVKGRAFPWKANDYSLHLHLLHLEVGSGDFL
jgi:hypothetical protein